MKFLCTSDLHGVIPTEMKNVVKRIDPDGILYAGDYAPHVWDEGRLEEVLEFIVSLHVPVYSVFGNMDPEKEYFENFEKNHENFHFIHAKRVKVGNLFIVGVGDYYSDPFSIEKFENLVKQSPENTIVVSHYPPYGVLDMTTTGENAGKIELKNVLDKYRPLVFLCGHIHESAGISKIGRTTVINTAMKLLLLEVENGQVHASLA